MDSNKPEMEKVAVESSAAVKPAESTSTNPIIQENKPASGGSKKIIIIVVAVIVVCGLCSIAGFVINGMLAGASEKLTELAEEEIVNQVEDEINDNVNSDGDEDTDFSFMGTASLPTDFPSDYPLLEEGQLYSATGTDNSYGGKDYVLAYYYYDLKASQISSWYKDALIEEGWELETESSFFGYTAVFNKDEFQSTITVLGGEEAEEGEQLMSIVTLTITEVE